MRIVTVSELASHLQQLFRLNPALRSLWVRGEVADLRRSPAGHLYFTLRDDEAQLRCALFRRAALRIGSNLVDGQAVVAHGALSFYPATGACELLVDLVYPEGVGVQRLQFEALKLRLEQDGLFAPERKRPLRPFPRRIGVVSSEAGAVIHDIVTVLRRRYPLAEVVFAPSAVQGERAPIELVAALRRLKNLPDDGPQGVDVIIVARGGGSDEDLAAFNDERVVREVYASRVPVVSAVGHEIDYTLTDLVADVRAPTPSAAAELATPDRLDLTNRINGLVADASSRVQSRLNASRERVEARRERLLLSSPKSLSARRHEMVQACTRRAEHQVQLTLTRRRHELQARMLQLEALDPQSILRRGYAICYGQSEQLVRAPEQVSVGERIRVRVEGGSIHGRVTERAP